MYSSSHMKVIRVPLLTPRASTLVPQAPHNIRALYEAFSFISSTGWTGLYLLSTNQLEPDPAKLDRIDQKRAPFPTLTPLRHYFWYVS